VDEVRFKFNPLLKMNLVQFLLLTFVDEKKYTKDDPSTMVLEAKKDGKTCGDYDFSMERLPALMYN